MPFAGYIKGIAYHRFLSEGVIVMEQRQLEVELREGRGKGYSRKLRRAGKIPGVFYGPNRDSVAITLEPKKLHQAIETRSGLNTILNLVSSSKELDGTTAMLKDFQEDPVRSGFIHADLVEIDLKKPIQVSVPVELAGTPAGVSMGGTLEHLLWEVEVECLPLDVPDQIELDVSLLEIGDSVHVSDIKLADNIKLLTDAELPIGSVLAPRLVEEAVPVEEAEALAEGEEPVEVAPGEKKPEKPEKAQKSEKAEKEKSEK
jgi:large subunit ribosomal protein L25